MRADYRKTIENRYRAGDDTRFSRDMSGSVNTGTSADWHYQQEWRFFRAMEVARSIDRDDPVVPQAVSRLIKNLLQDGFTLDPKTGNDDVDAHIKDRWNFWGKEPDLCDYAGEHAFKEQSELALRHTMIDGDHFVLPLSSGRLQSVEAHRCRTPHGIDGPERILTVHGITLDENRRRQKFHFTQDDISMYHTPMHGDMITVDARDRDGNRQVFQTYHPLRMSQSRGVTRLRTIIEYCGLLDDTVFAKLVQQQSVSVFGLIRERDMSGNFPSIDQEDMVYQDQETCEPGETRPMRDIAAGTWYTTYPGETIKPWSPNVPNPTFDDQVKRIIEMIGANLDMPYTMMTMDASSGSFSSHRGSHDQAKLAFRCVQAWWARMYHQPTYMWKMRQWLTPGGDEFDPLLYTMWRSGRVNIFNHEWVYPSWPYLEPLKDIQADVLETRSAQNSPRRVQARRGRDREVISTEIVDDNALAIVKAKTAAEEINGQFDDDQPVHWRELMSLPMPEGVQVNLSNEMEDDEETEPQAMGNQPNGE
jgi:capsid protein